MAIYKGKNIKQNEHFDKCSKYVGVILDERKPIGTGVFVRKDNQIYFITAKHVLNLDIFTQSLIISYNFSDSGGEKSSFLQVWKCIVEADSDIAIIPLGNEISGITAFELSGEPYENLKTEFMLMWGCPTQLTMINGPEIRNRLINLICKVVSDDVYIRLNINYELNTESIENLNSLGGVSGGPVFNIEGKLVGINKQELKTPNSICALEASKISETSFFNYIDINLRKAFLYEIPYLVASSFDTLINNKKYSLSFNSLIAIDFDGDPSYMNSWISYGVIFLNNKAIYCMDLPMAILLEVGDHLSIKDKVFESFTTIGLDKIKELAKEYIYMMLYKETSKNNQPIILNNFQVRRIADEKLWDIIDQYPFHPKLHPLKSE